MHDASFQRSGPVPRFPWRVVVASSGLGHYLRGVEAWAEDLGQALDRAGVAVRLFKGGGEAIKPYETVLPCWSVYSRRARLASKLLRHYFWRWGLDRPDGVQQLTFVRRLIRVAGEHDILHTQDPWVAHWVEQARRRGKIRSQLILAHGTEESLSFLRSFDHVQELAPNYLEEDRRQGVDKQWYAIPNFIDCTRFAPVGRSMREDYEIGEGDFVILVSAAIKRHHKRVDFAIVEFEQLVRRFPEVPFRFVIAGASEDETPEMIRLGHDLLGDRVQFLVDHPRQKMPDVYRMADVIVHAAVFEMLGISLLEAMACGVPAIVNDTPTLRWVVSDTGSLVDMEKPGSVCDALAEYLEPELLGQRSEEARRHVVDHFSEGVVVPKILSMYDEVASSAGRMRHRRSGEDHP
jgi:glycosyltransferase involved in cell wall biosynthesis